MNLANRLNMDGLLIAAQLVLGALGVLGVAAAQPESWLEQVILMILALVIVITVSRFPPRLIAKLSTPAYFLVFILLVLVLFIGVSPEGSEAKRWLPFFFGITIQPSELMKVTVIAYLAAFFYNHIGEWEIWRPMLVIGLAAGLILIEPNISTTIFIFLLAFTMMVIAGTSVARLARVMIPSALIATIFTASFLYFGNYDYVFERLTAFVDTRGEQALADSSSFQAVRAQYTLTRAGNFGIGPGLPVRVPEAETDMVSVAVGQALGLNGILMLIFMYIVIAVRGIKIASARAGPGSLLAGGATAYICGQAALNLLVASGWLPVTGVVLPFVSQGINNLVSVAVAMGFLQSSYRQAKKEGVAL